MPMAWKTAFVFFFFFFHEKLPNFILLVLKIYSPFYCRPLNINPGEYFLPIGNGHQSSTLLYADQQNMSSSKWYVLCAPYRKRDTNLPGRLQSSSGSNDILYEIARLARHPPCTIIIVHNLLFGITPSKMRHLTQCFKSYVSLKNKLM